MNERCLNYLAPINPLGYGVVGTNVLLELLKMGIDVSTWPIGQVTCSSDDLKEIKPSIENRHKYEVNAPSLRIWHQHDLAQHVGKGLHAGFPIFELTVLTKIEQNEMYPMDYLFVCSKWAKNVVMDNMPGWSPNTVVTPLGVNRTIFHENVGQADNQWTTFLNIGKWEYRKGHDIIVEAFNLAFEPNERVRLWMMNHNPFLKPQQVKEWENLYKNSDMGHRINILPRVDTHAEVAQIMAQATCGVFPARAEGWNLEVLEMMSMGKPVIVTDYSAHTEFCHHQNSLLVNIDALEDAYDGIFFGNDTKGQWAALDEPQVDAIIEHMRYVHRERPENPHGIATAKQHSWSRTAQIVAETLDI